MAGEDRFHVAVSEEHGWVFVGIYDGFNGPDATNYLFANLYVVVHSELKGVLWDDIQAGDGASCGQQEAAAGNAERLCLAEADGDSAEAKRRRTEVPMPGNNAIPVHRDVLRALARALKKTEEAFFVAVEEHAAESPQLGLMGSCVLVMVMKGTDVYVMNVGDSRAVLARRLEPDLKNVLGKASQDLQQFKAKIMRELEAHDMDGLQAVQLTAEHSTAVQEVGHTGVGMGAKLALWRRQRAHVILPWWWTSHANQVLDVMSTVPYPWATGSFSMPDPSSKRRKTSREATEWLG
ncbi:probable protein phosphatase 2C 31 [Miscanthus floridulus]|uniref:probable protein phosphatase 2C 31 n=1 Tax=Miscanthus floridulus TaxID=154761 RepID=UPI0034577876